MNYATKQELPRLSTRLEEHPYLPQPPDDPAVLWPEVEVSLRVVRRLHPHRHQCDALCPAADVGGVAVDTAADQHRGYHGLALHFVSTSSDLAGGAPGACRDLDTEVHR